MDSSGSPENEVDGVSDHRTHSIQSHFPSARVVIEARLPIVGRIGSHLRQYLAVRRD